MKRTSVDQELRSAPAGVYDLIPIVIVLKGCGKFRRPKILRHHRRKVLAKTGEENRGGTKANLDLSAVRTGSSKGKLSSDREDTVRILGESYLTAFREIKGKIGV